MKEKKTTKPPIGLLPRWLFEEKRYKEITEAMKRFENAGKPFPEEWIEEHNELHLKISQHQSKRKGGQVLSELLHAKLYLYYVLYSKTITNSPLNELEVELLYQLSKDIEIKTFISNQYKPK